MKFKRLGALLVSAALCAGMAAPAFAFEGEAAPVEQPVLPEVVEEDIVTVTDETSGALTPEGNLTLVDDYHTDYSDGSGQQFITLVSKSGNTFYLVIDRNAKGQQTVHFMNLVDEADLLALMEEDAADAYALKIDPEFQGKIPPLTFEELNQLEANILRDGRIINPIIVWQGLIVDGHNRYTIAKKHPEIPFTVHEKEFASRYEAIIWICKNQLGRRNLTPEQKKYLIGKQYEAEKLNHGGDQKSNLKKSTGQNGQSIDKRWTRQRIADENGVNDSFVKRAEQFSKGVDAAEEAVPGTRQKVLSGEVKSTAAEIASVARAPPEERPALVAEICKPKPPKPPAQKQKAPPAVAAPLPNASTSEEECTDEELVHTPAPQEQTFPQRVNEPLKIDRQQILKIANSRYVPKRLADGTAMLCEVSGAANSMMRRWESVFREYPDILSDAENRASVERTIQKLRDYLKNLEDKMEELL